MDIWVTRGTATAASVPCIDGKKRARHRTRRLAALAAAGGLVVALSGCTGDGSEAAVKAAQAQVSAAEEALAQAESDAQAAADALCSASADYITALDRYGDVLNQTAVTVGDVKVAGQDLTEPRQETVDAGQAAVDARDAVAQAEQDLADAQAALAAAEASAAGESPEESEESEESAEEPEEPSATVARVQQAEAEFATAQAGITDKTPLVQAAEQFNAAAVALEMAWLQLFAESGCLSDEQQEQAADAVEDYTLTLQESLSAAGYYEGEVDGVYGPQTVAAVESLQKEHGLPQTGAVDKATAAALSADLAAVGGAVAQDEVASTAAIQQTLSLAGYWDGPIDGQWTDELTDAIEELQEDLGVPTTGEVDAATIAAFEEAIEAATQTPSPSPSSPSPTDQAPSAEATASQTPSASGTAAETESSAGASPSAS